jgi:LAO/AO transport system kinase
MELADLVLVNKADGDLAMAARHSAADYRSALTLIHPRTSGWKIPVKTCSAVQEEGLTEAWDLINAYREFVSGNGQLVQRRALQAKSWMWSEISEGLLTKFRQDDLVRSRLPELERGVTGGKVPPTLAATTLLDLFLYNQ